MVKMMMKLNKTTQLLCRCVELFHVSTNDQRFQSTVNTNHE